MKRYIIPLLGLLLFMELYNAQTIQNVFWGFIGDYAYKKEDFSKAEDLYGSVLKDHSWSILLEADVLYNLGNTLYRLGEKTKDDERIKLWKESIGNYTKSLSLRIDQDTEENLAFVKERLGKEMKEQEDKKKKKEEEEQKKETSGSWTKDIPWTKSPQSADTPLSEPSSPRPADTPLTEGGKKESPTQKPKSWQNWSNGWSYNPIGWSTNEDAYSSLSDADKQEIQKYLEQLKKFEKQNGKLLNPEKSNGVWSISDQIRNFFWEDSFFQDVMPTNDGKKDW